MDEPYDAGPYLPGRGGLPAHRRAAAECHGCPLYRPATQTVFGTGTSTARLMVVGEEPGDQEDRQGLPFVGPAGRLLRRAMAEAGLPVEGAYLTNAVKHFTYERRGSGKRRIHKPPSLRELTACAPWLDAELRLVAPDVVVALGGTAVKALLGRDARVGRVRGEPRRGRDTGHAVVVATLHPSAVLRADDRAEQYAGLVADLRVAAEALGRRA
ncbi:UdgX family uracil-DNA binding protein [Streptomyces sp. NPDC047002]|uniref:UdgX family uracil-DNA binding protein n=1 Tax=Streptomyces sp. NPDC047002 TaxID=3155475 RepID=UPI0034555A75